MLIPTLLDGLIWRSARTEKGLRRVNYYVPGLVRRLSPLRSSIS